ncbi:MAG TPA: outer membrane protein transport protein [Polyangia bacterium]|nr:outer membrane protein transport protein [Polyangia bacterium]
MASRPAAATPIDDPFVGGMSFSGPTSGDLGAVYWNPAALGLMHGFQLMVAGTARWSSIGASLPAGSATARDLRQPFQWPAGPGAYVAVGYGSDRITLAVASYMPYLEQIHFPTSPAGTEPTRYQMLSMDLRNLALVPALAIRIGNELRVGLAPGVMFSTGSLSFAEDTASDNGTGAPGTADARYNIDSGQGLGSAKVSLTLGGGVYYRHRNVEIGLSYQSRPLGTGVSGVDVAGGQSSVTLPPSQWGGPLTCAGGQSVRCVYGDVTYRLPDVFIGGVTWHLRPGLQLDLMARWLWTHLQDRIDIRLIGPTLEASGIPQHVVLYRGFHDVVDARGRIAYWWRERLRVAAELRIETSAVDTNAVNAAAVDGIQFEPVLLAELRVSRRFWLGAGYGLTIMPSVTVNNSIFDPTAAANCAKANGDLNAMACQARQNGTARPSASGTYTSLAQDFGLTFNAKF